MDNGSWWTKAGFGGEDEPRSVFRTLASVPYQGVLVVRSRKRQYIGDECLANRGILTLQYPVQRGIITNWIRMVCTQNILYVYYSIYRYHIK